MSLNHILYKYLMNDIFEKNVDLILKTPILSDSL